MASQIAKTAPCQKRYRRGSNCNYWQWLDRFKQYRKTNCDTDIGALIKQGTITEIDCNSKEETQQVFFQALRLEAAHQITRTDYHTEPDKKMTIHSNCFNKLFYQKETTT